MPKRFIRRFLPTDDAVRHHRHVRVFGRLLHDPNLWHLNRRSVAGAVSVGIFTGFLPILGQMPVAAALAIAFRINLPLAVAMVWVSNPFTMPPLFYFAYRIGSWVLGRPPGEFHFELTWDWFVTGMLDNWAPLAIGCVVVGSVGAAAGYGLVRLAWRVYVVRKANRRIRARTPRRGVRRLMG